MEEGTEGLVLPVSVSQDSLAGIRAGVTEGVSVPSAARG